MSIAFVANWTSAQFNNNTGGTLSGRTSTAGNFVAITGSVSNSVSFSVSHSQSGSVQDSGLGLITGGTDLIFTKYIENIAGGVSHTITVTTNVNQFSSLNAAEYSGVATSGSLDQTAQGASNSTSLLTAATSTTSQPDELLIGNGTINATTNNTFTAGGSYTIRGQIGNALSGGVSYLEDRIVAATGTYTSSATWSGSAGVWVASIVTFKAVGGAPSNPPVQLIPTQSAMRLR